MRRYLTALLSVFALLMGYEAWGQEQEWRKACWPGQCEPKINPAMFAVHDANPLWYCDYFHDGPWCIKAKVDYEFPNPIGRLNEVGVDVVFTVHSGATTVDGRFFPDRWKKTYTDIIVEDKQVSAVNSSRDILYIRVEKTIRTTQDIRYSIYLGASGRRGLGYIGEDLSGERARNKILEAFGCIKTTIEGQLSASGNVVCDDSASNNSPIPRLR